MDNVIEIEVDGQLVILDISADTTMSGIDEDMDSIASLLSWYGNILSAARQHHANLDADYRHWRARIAQNLISKNERLAEHKIKSAIEADRAFVNHKRAIASAHRLVGRIEKAWFALDMKGRILQSKGALLRSELQATNMHTPANPGATNPTPRRGGRTDKDIEDRKAKAAEAMKRKRRRTADDDEDDD